MQIVSRTGIFETAEIIWIKSGRYGTKRREAMRTKRGSLLPIQWTTSG